MRHLGILDKMPTSFINPVQYFLQLGEDRVAMNELVGKHITFKWTGNIYCTVCGRKTKKSFGEGMCYPCFSSSPENADCIFRPELCEGHLDKGRDVEWEKKHHVQPHYIYLALVNEVKVGVTRDSQIPTRWIDQGANKAIILAQTPYRQLAGLIEVSLKNHLTDKTHWMKMLTNQFNYEVDLLAEKKRIKTLLSEELQQYYSDNDEIIELLYPTEQYPAKVVSTGFEKTPVIESRLTGIRGQYVYFGNSVMNIRKHSGYEVELIY
jgi:hypothetical protein